MAMEDSLDFASVFRSREVIRRQHKLAPVFIQIPARPISTPAFDHHHQAASLTRIFLGRMKRGFIFPAHTV